METFLTKHNGLITGSLSCFDRLIFKGYLPLGYPSAMEGLLSSHGILIKDFGRFVKRQGASLQAHARALAEAAGRPLIHLNGRQRKETFVDRILKEDPVETGLICILSAVETGPSFRVASGEGRPRLARAPRKCLCYYFYYSDPVFGRLHVRLQTWFPLTIQVYLNGHDWLALAMSAEGLDFEQEDNCFTRLGDCERARELADEFVDLAWPAVLNRLASRVNPLLTSLLAGLEYYWVIDQAEYATDVLFDKASTLTPLFEELLRQATLGFGAEDVMRFLGRKLTPQFKGEIKTSSRRRAPGARIKHWMKGNWIKMYSKAGSVLRIETVINHPYEFRVRRRGKRKGRQVTGWFPLAKGVKNLRRYREVTRSANRRYLQALAAFDNPAPGHKALERVCERASYKKRTQRGINPLRRDDLALLKATMRGEHCIHGFRNRDLAEALGLKKPRDPAAALRQSAWVTRKLHLLHAHKLVAKIPRSRRWRVTANGVAIMNAAIQYREQVLAQATAQKVA